MTQALGLKVDSSGLEEWMTRMEEKIDRLLQGREGKAPADERSETYYTGPEFLLKFRCGREKLKQLVTAGAVERNNHFGKNPRYRWIGKEETA